MWPLNLVLGLVPSKITRKLSRKGFTKANALGDNIILFLGFSFDGLWKCVQDLVVVNVSLLFTSFKELM